MRFNNNNTNTFTINLEVKKYYSLTNNYNTNILESDGS